MQVPNTAIYSIDGKQVASATFKHGNWILEFPNRYQSISSTKERSLGHCTSTLKTRFPAEALSMELVRV